MSPDVSGLFRHDAPPCEAQDLILLDVLTLIPVKTERYGSMGRNIIIVAEAWMVSPPCRPFHDGPISLQSLVTVGPQESVLE